MCHIISFYVQCLMEELCGVRIRPIQWLAVVRRSTSQCFTLSRKVVTIHRPRRGGSRDGLGGSLNQEPRIRWAWQPAPFRLPYHAPINSIHISPNLLDLPLCKQWHNNGCCTTPRSLDCAKVVGCAARLRRDFTKRWGGTGLSKLPWSSFRATAAAFFVALFPNKP